VPEFVNKYSEAQGKEGNKKEGKIVETIHEDRGWVA